MSRYEACAKFGEHAKKALQLLEAGKTLPRIINTCQTPKSAHKNNKPHFLTIGYQILTFSIKCTL